MVALAFRLSLAAVAFGAFRFGDRPERLVASAYLLAAILTEALRSAVAGRYHGLERGVGAVDLLLLIALIAISLRFDRRWLIWASALQCVTVLGHAAKLLKPEVWPLAYAWMVQASSFPSLIVLAIGIATSRGSWREQKRSPKRC